MFALKLTLVPAFLLMVSLSGKWWGPTIAGWLAGLPVVAGPILFLLALAHGPHFAAQATTLSLLRSWHPKRSTSPMRGAAALGTG